MKTQIPGALRVRSSRLKRFWTLAAMLYLTAGHNTAPLIVIALFTTAAAFLIIAIAAATAVFRALQPDPLPVAPEGGQQPL